MNHWIIAPVILPAILGPLIILVMRHDLALQRIFSLGGTLVLAAISAGLLYTASVNPPEAYLLGNWPTPFGIVLVLDRLSAIMVALTATLAICVQLYAIGSGWDSRGKHFHALFQFQLMGICGAFLTGDAFNLFVFFEVLLIASYGLMIHSGGKQRLRAGVQYVAFNLVGSTLFLFSLATLYSVTGTLNMADMAVKVAELPPGDVALLRVGAVLMLLVFAIKGALVPLQFWLPNTYAFAPGPVAALFAVMTKVGAYAILRMYTLVFAPDTAASGTLAQDLLLPAAIVTLAVGAIGILGATGLARMVAFSAIGSMGTLFIAISLFTIETTTAALYYLIHSTLAAAAMFLVADLVTERRGTDNLGVTLPPMARHGLVGSLFFAATVAMAGMPPLSGFIGKLLILDATRGDDMALIWSTILIGSLITIVGFARAGSTVFWKAHACSTSTEMPEPANGAMPFVATFTILGLLVAMTVFAGPITEYLQATSVELYDRAAYITAVMGQR